MHMCVDPKATFSQQVSGSAKGAASDVANEAKEAAMSALMNKIKKHLPARYHALFLPIVTILTTGGTFKDAGKSWSDAFYQKDRSTAAMAFVGDMRNLIFLKVKMNPCSWECVCKQALKPLVDAEYMMVVRAPLTENNPYLKKISDHLHMHPLNFNEIDSFNNFQRYANAGGIDGWGKIPTLTSEAYGSRLDRFWDHMTDSPGDSNFDESKAKGLLCRKKPGGGCVLGTQSRYWLLSLRPVKNGHPDLTTVTCSMFLSARIDLCASCCCRNGLVRASFTSGLLQRSTSYPCVHWFMYADTILRTGLSLLRTFHAVQITTVKGCFKSNG